MPICIQGLTRSVKPASVGGMETHGRTPEDDEQAGATDNRETPAVNRYGYPPLLGECLCGHQFRMHGTPGSRCWATVWVAPFAYDPEYCECILFEAAVR